MDLSVTPGLAHQGPTNRSWNSPDLSKQAVALPCANSSVFLGRGQLLLWGAGDVPCFYGKVQSARGSLALGGLSLEQWCSLVATHRASRRRALSRQEGREALLTVQHHTDLSCVSQSLLRLNFCLAQFGFDFYCFGTKRISGI